MLKSIFIAFLVAVGLSILLGLISIPLLKKLKAGQTVLKYVSEHKSKNGTPTMGGLFFITASAVAFLIVDGLNSKLSIVVLCIGLSFMLVGFLDDFIKIKFHQNEGLTAIQKILFQTSIALIAGVYAYVNGLTEFYIPFINLSVDFGAFTIILIAVTFIAMTNCVNLTDGLDGLAGGTSAVYLIFISFLVFIQNYGVGTVNFESDYYGLIILSTCLLGGIFGFLLFNVNRAKVFMGDTGSLSLGGFLAGISVFSSNSLVVPILGIAFVISGVSVILQVVYFKRTKKRIFLMAPFHHHLQHKGYTETQICYLYSLITCIMGALVIIFYL